MGFYRKLDKRDLNDCLTVLGDGDVVRAKQEDKVIMHQWFEDGYIGYGYYEDDRLIAYSFIKRPHEHPESTTVVMSKYRSNGIATLLKKYVLSRVRDSIKGDIVYSAANVNNIPSIKANLNCGYKITGVTHDKQSDGNFIDNVQFQYVYENCEYGV